MRLQRPPYASLQAARTDIGLAVRIMRLSTLTAKTSAFVDFVTETFRHQRLCRSRPIGVTQWRISGIFGFVGSRARMVPAALRAGGGSNIAKLAARGHAP